MPYNTYQQQRLESRLETESETELFFSLHVFLSGSRPKPSFNLEALVNGESQSVVVSALCTRGSCSRASFSAFALVVGFGKKSFLLCAFLFKTERVKFPRF